MIIKIFLWSFLLLLMPIIGNAQSTQLTLTWDANTELQLAGYKVYYGSASRNYDYNVDVGNQTTYSLEPLSGDQTTYFAVTAYDSNGLESEFSDEVSWTASQDQTGFVVSQSAGKAPLYVTFSVAPPINPYADYDWSFGDGQIARGESVSHMYASQGTYVAALKISDTIGILAEHFVTITVTAAEHANEPPTAIISASKKRGATPLSVSFSGAQSWAAGEREIVSYRWNFGDGFTSDGVEASHTFEYEAEYTLTLKVTDNLGGTDTARATIKVDSKSPNILPILLFLLLDD